MTNKPETATSKPGVSRRTIVKGTAWAVPAVVVATATPAMASASHPVLLTVGAVCKIPGSSWKDLGYDKGYVYFASFTNNTGGPVSIQVTSVSIGNSPQCLVGTVDSDGSSCGATSCISNIAVGATRQVAIFSNSHSDSSSTTVNIGFTYYAGTTCSGTPLTDVQSSSFVGQSWTTGGGSCDIPTWYNNKCDHTPLTALGSSCV